MPKMDFLDHQEAEKINKQKWKQFWWTPCIVAYFQNQRSKTKQITKPVGLIYQNVIVIVKVLQLLFQYVFSKRQT